MSVRILLALAIASVAAPAYAQRLDSCAKVDYAEAKDWAIDEVERNYCHDITHWRRAQEILRKEGPSGNPGIIKYVMQQTAGCDVQAALYERILKNVHKRPLPACN